MRARSLASFLVSFGLLALVMPLGCFKNSGDDEVGDEMETETGAPAAVCGNAIVEDDEACDDGNDDDTDACLSSCVAASCGDGLVQARVELCDDGNATAGDGCSATCTLESCGNGVVDEGEECDDGNTVPTDECLSTCLTASCGDGFVQADVEACDDGNMVDTDACVTGCIEASCGDGFVRAGVEACDDGNVEDTDACLSTCANASCGDGFIEAGIEECDDSNGVGGDGCSTECLMECGADCWAPEGCMTDGGRCIRFTCRAGNAGADFCDTCMGWNEITHTQWLSGGYCADVSAKYRANYGYATACGGNPTCCADQASCAGSDNAWHFAEGGTNYFVGPCLGCMQADDCMYWNDVDDSEYTRISACERQ